MNKNNIINFVGFQVIWLAAVLGAAHSILWPCFIISVTFTVWQLLPNNRHINDHKLLALALPIGFLADSSWQVFGLVNYASNPIAPLAPPWIMCLWLAFALTFNHSLAWLKNNKFLILAFGFIGSPFSYWAGSRLGAMEYVSDFNLVSLVLAVSWAFILLLLFTVVSKDKLSPKATPNSTNNTEV